MRATAAHARHNGAHHVQGAAAPSLGVACPGAVRTGTRRDRDRGDPGRSAGGGAPRPHQGRADPRSVPRRQRVRARLDRARRLDLRHRVHPPRRRDRCGIRARTGLRGSRHRRDRLVERCRHRGGREPAPQPPHRRDRPRARGREPPRRGVPQPRFGTPNAQSVALGARPRPYPTPFDAIRKSACSFGWDWGIATSTSGIWRPVRLESWSTARLEDVLVRASPAAYGRRRRGGRHGEASGCRGRGRSRRAEPGSSRSRARAPRR